MEFPDPGPAKLLRIIVGLQALTLACLVSWLVLFHGSRVALKGTKSRARTATEGLGTERDDETAGDLIWIGNENSADEPLSFDKEPFSLLHFRVRLPAGHSGEPSSRSRIQPIELVFHSSWSPIPDAISLHISNDGVSAFQGSYLSQYPSGGQDDSRNFAARDAGTILVDPPSVTHNEATRRFREAWYGRLIIIAVVASFASIALGVADIFALSGNDSFNRFPWPQAAESQPLALWDQAWEVLGLWAEVMEPLMPDEALSNSNNNNIYAAFHSLPSPHQTISGLCDQLSFISSSTSGANTGALAGGAVARETIVEACDTADKNIDQFDSDWADLLSYFSRGWLKQPIQELYSAGYNTSRFQNAEETTTANGDGSWSYGFTAPEGTGVGLDNLNHTFNNQTALRLLAIANPSFPKLQPSAANMTRRLRSIQAHARTAAESIAVVSDLVPRELRPQAENHREESLDASFAKQWAGFDFHSWWSGDETASGYGSAATRRAAKEMARLHDVLKAFHADVTESVRRADAVESSLDILGQKVAELAQVKKPKGGQKSAGISGLDGAWVTLGWRADCRWDGESGPSPISAAATPVVVAYFVPSAETLFQGMKKSYRLLADRQSSAIRRREGAFAKKEGASHKRWHEYSLEHGGAAVDEEDCIDMPVYDDGSRTCLTLDEVGARVRSRLRGQFGADRHFGMALGRGGVEEQLLDG